MTVNHNGNLADLRLNLEQYGAPEFTEDGLPVFDSVVIPELPPEELVAPIPVVYEFDGDLYDDYNSRAPVFNEKKGRFNPFEPRKLEEAIGSYSTFLKRAIITFEDSLQHAMRLSVFWATEDEDETPLSTDVIVPKKTAAREQYEQELEEARVAWRNAVRDAKEARAKWDDFVTSARVNYQRIKAKRKR